MQARSKLAEQCAAAQLKVISAVRTTGGLMVRESSCSARLSAIDCLPTFRCSFSCRRKHTRQHCFSARRRHLHVMMPILMKSVYQSVRGAKSDR